jgi:SAM-dependent methyltransferase
MYLNIEQWKEIVRPFVVTVLAAVGKSHFCPCCKQHCIRFLPWGKAQNIFCPNCGTFPRHRALYLYLQTQPDFYHKNQKVLHFAPNHSLRKHFSSLSNLDYLTADLKDPSVDVKIDLTQIAYPDNTFDVIFCSHVLEHVMNDLAAIHELFRILKPGGWAFLAVPIREKANTFEDPKIVSPEERKHYFGQRDHVRFYGYDYKDRLEAAGFTVNAVRKEKLLSNLTFQQRKKYGLHGRELFHFVTK